jgi:hypothetical protein
VAGRLRRAAVALALALVAWGPTAAQTTTEADGKAAGQTKLDEKTAAAVAYCKELYADHRLDPLRGVVTLGEPPNAEMKKNPLFVSDEERAALDAFRPLVERCRAKMAEANPHLAAVMHKLQPDPYEKLIQLRGRQITIGQYNAYRQEFTDKLRDALLSAAKKP